MLWIDYIMRPGSDYSLLQILEDPLGVKSSSQLAAMIECYEVEKK